MPVSASRADPGSVRSCRAVRDSGFLTYWASSATRRPQATSASAAAVEADDAVGDQNDLVLGDVGEVTAAAVVAAHRECRGEAGDFAFPVAEQRGGAHDEGRAARRLPVQVQRDDLDGLAESHVVGEEPAETEVGHGGEPAQPVYLVGAQGGVQGGGHRDVRQVHDGSLSARSAPVAVKCTGSPSMSMLPVRAAASAAGPLSFRRGRRSFARTS